MPRRRGKGSKAEAHVSKLYRKAGYKVQRNLRSKAGEVDILAKRGHERLLIEVKSGRQTITSRDVLKVVHKARYHKAKPVIKKSSSVTLTSTAKEVAKKHNVRIRNY